MGDKIGLLGFKMQSAIKQVLVEWISESQLGMTFRRKTEENNQQL
jgi:hypothetical protein